MIRSVLLELRPGTGQTLVQNLSNFLKSVSPQLFYGSDELDAVLPPKKKALAELFHYALKVRTLSAVRSQ